MTRLDARTVANRENAKKSTGPRTQEGKERSRANAFKHGLSGSGVAWPGEQEGELRAFVTEQVEADPVGPRDARESFLMEKVAGIAWQIDRVERAEEAHAAMRSANALADEHERRAVEVTRLVGLMEDEPARAVRGLLRTREGCDWIVDALKELLDACDADFWFDSHNIRLDALCAPVQPGRLRISRAKALGLAMGCAEYRGVWPNGIPGFEDDLPDGSSKDEYRARDLEERKVVRQHRPSWQAELRGILERRLAEIEALRDQLRAQPDPGLAYAGIAATFDHTESGERLRRHIRARERQQSRLQADLDAYRARIAEAGAAEEVREPEPLHEPLHEVPAPVATDPPASPPADAALNVEGLNLITRGLREDRLRFVEADPVATHAGRPRFLPDRKNL